ncbi:tyrosine recombinase XerC [Bacillus sp. P14.5]|uniref:tyrosine recombinase XerC n=1 Tax=Bacillus sp. P14.5 TaxID=1983400 RepID=UPI000DEB53F7|nr:tyrosine recombinase XerC [Bacillus sp. P14.5]
MLENANQYLNNFITYLQIEKNYSEFTVTFYKDDIREFFLFMNEQNLHALSEIEYFDARLFLTGLHERNFARASISRKISSLRSFFRFLNREGTLTENPFALVSSPKSEKRLPKFFYEEEMETLFRACEGEEPLQVRNRAMFELFYATGIRVSECAGLRMKDIDFSLSTILVNGKGSKERYVPFGTYAHEELEMYINISRGQLMKNEEHEYVFVNYKGGPLTARGIRHVLNGIVKKASLTAKIHPHMLRHTFATHLLNNGADMRTVQELLGHENLSSTQIYTHVTKDHLRKTYLNHHPRA